MHTVGTPSVNSSTSRPVMPGQVAAVGHLVVADRLRALDLDALAVRQHAVERLERQPGRLSRSSGQVTIRTSVKPRCRAASARFRASPE